MIYKKLKLKIKVMKLKIKLFKSLKKQSYQVSKKILMRIFKKKFKIKMNKVELNKNT